MPCEATTDRLHPFNKEDPMLRPTVKRFLATAFAAAIIIAPGLMNASPAHAASKLGPLDQHGQLGPYCQQVVFRDMAAKWAINASPDNAMNPYTWKCRYTPFGVGPLARGIDMNAACRWAYGNGGAYAQTWNRSWAWSWDCWR